MHHLLINKFLVARILRAFRIAARLGFSFTKDLAQTVRELSASILRLDKVSIIRPLQLFVSFCSVVDLAFLFDQGRILMEMNYMLAFGSAEASLRLLWRFGLLEFLLPVQVMSMAMLSSYSYLSVSLSLSGCLTWLFNRHLTSFHKALRDATKELICYLYISNLRILFPFLLF